MKMKNSVIYIRRPSFSSRSKISAKLCSVFGVKELLPTDGKCTVLTNQEMVIAIRKRIIDIVLLSNQTLQEKEYIYIKAKSVL